MKLILNLSDSILIKVFIAITSYNLYTVEWNDQGTHNST